jgi:hypothetical protein
MPMTCIPGSFRIQGTEPDGDSLRFFADDRRRWSDVPGAHRVRVNAHGGAQLRLDAIDALETHYAPPGGHELHQPLELAHAAADELLSWLGFTHIDRDGEAITHAEPGEVRGFVLTRGADVHGRCVALVGRGEAPQGEDGQVFVGVDLLAETANLHLMSAGLVYPTFYSNLFPDLRAEFTRQAQAARAGEGLWPHDTTQSGTEVRSLATLTDEAVILPKLFRRLADYLHLNGDDPSLAGFEDYLAQRDDRLFVLSTGHRTGFDFVVRVEGQTVRLTVPPEDLVFEEL